MRPRQTLPRLWLVSDHRNDPVLEAALRRLPRGSGLVLRHYHLGRAERARRFRALRRLCRRLGHTIVLAGPPELAGKWGADGSYGPPLPARGALRLASAHSLREIAAANRTGAGLVLLSPVFPTRSHPGAASLGALRFALIARRSAAPVLAMGGMNARSARRLRAWGWAAIDGLSQKMPRIPLDS